MCVYLCVGRENCDGYCMNGGTCVAGGTCVCSEGWTGDRCADRKEGEQLVGREAGIEAGVHGTEAGVGYHIWREWGGVGGRGYRR